MMDPATFRKTRTTERRGVLCAPAATKVRAADSILARTAKAIETEEIGGRHKLAAYFSGMGRKGAFSGRKHGVREKRGGPLRGKCFDFVSS